LNEGPVGRHRPLGRESCREATRTKGGNPPLKIFRRICKKAFISVILLTLGLFSFSGEPAQAADWSQGVVIRAERIEIKGLLPLLAVGNDGGPVLRLIAGEAKVYGMKMAAAHQSRGWGMEIADGGMVPIRGLQVDATALGFRIKGLPIQLGESFPSIVLHDVFMKVDQLEAKQIDLHALDMSAKPDVSLKPDGPVLDLRPFAKSSRKEMEEEINERLREMSTTPTKDETSEAEDGKSETEDGKPEDKEGSAGDEEGEDRTDGTDGSAEDPGSGSEPDDPNQAEPPPSGEGESSGKSGAVIEEKVKLSKTIGLVRARELVKEVRKYDASVTIKKGKKTAKADDYWAVVGLGLIRGTEVVLSAEGKDSRQAVDALVRFLTNR